MRIYFIYLSFFLSIFVTGCKVEETEQFVENPSTNQDLCFPPFGIDTSTVQMYMKLNGAFYKPVSNFTCIIPNFILGIDQLWINGSTVTELKVVTLMMPLDVQTGSYALQLNSPYDARYVPSGSINFLVDYGTLHITVHDMVNKHIEGGFEFHATNLDAPTQPFVDVTSGCFWVDY